MNKFTNPLDNIKVASPCSADWNEMTGNDRQKFCGSCQKNVYNLSGMTKDEAENLLLNAEGRLCVRFYKRADGTILTQDCPVGWAAFKRRVSRGAAAFASLMFGILGGLGINAFFNQKVKEEPPIMGKLAYKSSPTPTPKATPKEFIMGEMVVQPTPKQTPKKDLKPTIKKIVNSAENQG